MLSRMFLCASLAGVALSSDSVAIGLTELGVSRVLLVYVGMLPFFMGFPNLRGPSERLAQWDQS